MLAGYSAILPVSYGWPSSGTGVESSIPNGDMFRGECDTTM